MRRLLAIAPGIASSLAKSSTWQAFIAILVVFGVAVIGMLLASGNRGGGQVPTDRPARPPWWTPLGGAAVNVVAVLVVAWLIGSFVVSAPFPAIARQVDNSAVLRTVDRMMPRGRALPAGLPAAAQPARRNGLYSQVFSAFGGESQR